MPIVGPDQTGAVCQTLLAGGVAVLPTETVYGLACDALDAAAVAEVFRLKGRPLNNPLIVHVLDSVQAESLADDWPEGARVLSARFWPGPLTLVVKKAASVPGTTSAGLDSVALRSPAHPLARDVLARTGLALAAPSANRSGGLSPTTAEAAFEAMGEPSLLVLDGGPCQWGLESTVVDLSGRTPALLRPGPVSLDDLESSLGTPVVPVTDPKLARSPGMLGRHYAPKTPLRLAASVQPHEAGLVLSGAATATQIAMPQDAVRYGAMLFASLRALDALGPRSIVVEQPPQTPEWAAVNDRLRRASQG